MIRLPYPISANVYWKIVGGKGRGPARLIVSAEAQAYKRAAAVAVQLAGFDQDPSWPAPVGQAVEVCLQLHPKALKAKPQSKRSTGKAGQSAQSHGKATGSAPESLTASAVLIDLDNAIKVTLDALTASGLVWVDDRQVKRISAEYGSPCEGGGLTVWLGHIRQDDTSSICPVSPEFSEVGLS